MTLRRRGLIAATAGLALPAALAPRHAQAAWPERPVNMIVPWAAGGGTDAVARIIARALQEEYGRPVNVVNRPGAGGVVGHSEIVNANPDGYTIGFVTAEITTYRHAGQSAISHEGLAPVALMNFDAAAVNVNANSAWRELRQVVDAIRANPGRYKMSGFPVGAAYHLAFAGMLQRLGIDPKTVPVVPSQGAAPGFQELAGGGVDLTASSLPEGTAMRDTGRVRSVAVMSEERIASFPDVPTVKEAIGLDFAGGTWRGLAGPRNMNREAAQRLAASAKRIYESDGYRSFMTERGFGMRFADAEGFRTFMAEQDRANGETLKALGLAR
jgi:tripartite-type tricarboxylate transporter receptor subunit TctC